MWTTRNFKKKERNERASHCCPQCVKQSLKSPEIDAEPFGACAHSMRVRARRPCACASEGIMWWRTEPGLLGCDVKTHTVEAAITPPSPRKPTIPCLVVPKPEQGGRGNIPLVWCWLLLGSRREASMPPGSLDLNLFSSSGLLRWDNERMAEQRCGDQGRLTDAAAATHRDEMNPTEEAAADCLSLEEILGLYGQPINEEQAWAVCYQCCRTLAKGHRGRRSSSAAAGTSTAAARRISGPTDVRIERDGSVRVEHQSCEGKPLFKIKCVQAVRI